MGDLARHGGCLCRAIRYRPEAAPFDAGYCHCRLCQLSAGAPVLAFTTVPVHAFVIVQGDPVRYRSSNRAERRFCGVCGTLLAIRADYQPVTIDFSIASLDHPGEVVPGFHIWTSSRIGWFDTSDRLPRHPRFRPDTRGLSTHTGSASPEGA